jgi:predicted metal-binding membrane protein
LLLRWKKCVSGALQYFFWAHPEWWTVALCGMAWMLMLRHASQTGGHETRHATSMELEFVNWVGMIAAMMLPMVVNPVRVTAARSLWRRRHRAIAGFLAGYLAPWLLFGLVVSMIRAAAWTHTAAAAGLSFVIAAVWQQTIIHRRALAACHRTQPLAPLGWRADRDCLGFGGMTGVACVCTCWPIMLACAFTGHSLMPMISGTAMGFIERRSFVPRKQPIVAATLLVASYYGLLAFSE